MKQPPSIPQGSGSKEAEALVKPESEHLDYAQGHLFERRVTQKTQCTVSQFGNQGWAGLSPLGFLEIVSGAVRQPSFSGSSIHHLV